MPLQEVLFFSVLSIKSFKGSTIICGEAVAEWLACGCGDIDDPSSRPRGGWLLTVFISECGREHQRAA